MWQQIRKIRGKNSRGVSPLIIEGQVYSTTPEIADKLGEYFSNASNDDTIPLSLRIYKQISDNFYYNLKEPMGTTAHYNVVFNLWEVHKALRSCRNTAPGPDMISYDLIKHLPIQLITYLLKIYNKIWTTHIFPLEWKKAVIIPILKPGRDPSSPASYRPISLTNCVCKIMETMVNSRLIWYIDKHQLISPVQCGGRNGR